VVPSSSGSSTGLLEPEDDGTTTFWNAGNYWSNDTASRLERIQSSAARLWDLMSRKGNSSQKCELTFHLRYIWLHRQQIRQRESHGSV